MAPDAAVAASSPATPEPAPAIDLASLSPEDRQTWRETGELPKADSTPVKDSSEAASKGEAAKGEDAPPEEKAETTAPASEAEKSTQEQPHKRGNAESRLQEILADLKKAGLSPAELKTFKREAAKAAETKAEPSPAAPPTDTTVLKPPVKPAKPKRDDFENWMDYEAAKDQYDEDNDKYHEDLADYKSKLAVQQVESERLQREQMQKLSAEMEQAKQFYPDYEEKAKPMMTALKNDPAIPEAFKYAVGNSPVFAHLIYALSGEQTQTLLETSKTNAIKAVMQLGVLENAVMEELKKRTEPASAKPGTETGRDAAGKFVKSEEKETAPETPVTRVGKPPAEVGGRGTVTEDDGLAAARAGDFRGAKASWDRQYMARNK